MHPLKRALKQLDEEAAALSRLAMNRREVSGQDPAADALDYVAERLAKLRFEIETDVSFLTVADYADLHNVKPATVRRWIRSNELPANQGPSGDYFIPLTAVRRKRRRLPV